MSKKPKKQLLPIWQKRNVGRGLVAMQTGSIFYFITKCSGFLNVYLDSEYLNSYLYLGHQNTIDCITALTYPLIQLNHLNQVKEMFFFDCTPSIFTRGHAVSLLQGDVRSRRNGRKQKGWCVGSVSPSGIFSALQQPWQSEENSRWRGPCCSKPHCLECTSGEQRGGRLVTACKTNLTHLLFCSVHCVCFVAGFILYCCSIKLVLWDFQRVNKCCTCKPLTRMMQIEPVTAK